MTIRRRDFLTTAAVGAAGLAVAGPAHAAPDSCGGGCCCCSGGKPPAALKISSQLWVIPGKGLAEKLATMEKWGFDGVELSRDAVGNVKTFADAIKNTRLKVSALCFSSLGGDVVSEVAAKRAPAVEKMKQALESAGELGCTGMVYAPAFNGETRLPHEEIRKVLIDTLPALGEVALRHGTRLLLEPLNRKEAYFLRQVADAATICRDCNNAGVGVIADFYHMAAEETSALGAILSAGGYLHHVHLGSKTRVMPGQDPEDADFYLDGFRGLKMIGYHEYCSFECRCRAKPADDIPASMQFLRDTWAKAG
jgi:sugar phosphate isomerase/epimerase